MSFSFLHAADVHLDSQLLGLSRYEGAPVDAIRQATRRGFENLIDMAIERQVDFVVIAGDLYDGDWRDHNTGLYFTRQAQKLNDAGIPLFLVAGNHDAQNVMTRSLRLPSRTQLLSARAAQSVELPDLGVMIHGQSFATRAVLDDLSARYPAAVKGLYNIGVLHTSFTGREGHDSYAPCTLDGLKTRGYQYWALGHVHQREVIHKEPIVTFSGNVQGRHIRETGPKGCWLVTVADDHRTEMSFESLDVFRWQRRSIDVGPLKNEAELWAKAEEEFRALDEDAGGLSQAVRLELTGTTPLASRWLARKSQLTHELRNAAVQVSQERIWVEKVSFHVQGPRREAGNEAGSYLPLAELMAFIDELRSHPDQLQELGKDIFDMTRKLPADFNYEAAELALDRPETWLTLLSEAESLLTTRLTDTRGDDA